MLDHRSWEAQIGEIIRLVASLPDALKQNNFQAVHDDMLQDYRTRAPYVRYLTRLRQDLLVAQDQLVQQRDRLQRANQLYFQYHKTVQINSFVEKRENEIVAYAPPPSRRRASTTGDLTVPLGRGLARGRWGRADPALCNISTRSSCSTKRRHW